MSATAPSQTVFSIGYDFHAGNGTPNSGTDNGNVFGIINYKDTTHGRDQTFYLRRIEPAHISAECRNQLRDYGASE